MIDGALTVHLAGALLSKFPTKAAGEQSMSRHNGLLCMLGDAFLQWIELRSQVRSFRGWLRNGIMDLHEDKGYLQNIFRMAVGNGADGILFVRKSLCGVESADLAPQSWTVENGSIPETTEPSPEQIGSETVLDYFRQHVHFCRYEIYHEKGGRLTLYSGHPETVFGKYLTVMKEAFNREFAFQVADDVTGQPALRGTCQIGPLNSKPGPTYFVPIIYHSCVEEFASAQDRKMGRES